MMHSHPHFSSPLDLISGMHTSNSNRTSSDVLDKELIQNARDGNHAKVRALLRNGANGNTRDVFSDTPLLRAALDGRWQVVRELLNHKHVHVNADNDDGDTPLLVAVREGHVEVVMELLKHKDVDVNATTTNVESSRRLASIAVRPQVDPVSPYDFYLESSDEEHDMGYYGHDDHSNASHDDYGVTSLIMAVCEGHVELVIELLKHRDIDVNVKVEGGKTALGLACVMGRSDVVRELLKHKKLDVNAHDNRGETALHLATIGDKANVVRELLKHNEVDVNAINTAKKTCLVLAIGAGQRVVVRELLKHGKVEINFDNLMLACTKGHVGIVRALLAHDKVDVNGEGRADGAALHVLLNHPGFDLSIFRELLHQPKLDVNAVDTGGETALIMATRRYCQHRCYGVPFDAISDLLKHPQVNVNAKDNEGLTAFSYFSGTRNNDVFREFLKREDLHINERFTHGETALIRACFDTYNSVDNVRELLKHKNLDVNAKDDLGYTAFLWACVNGDVGVVCELLEHDDVDVNAKTDCGDTGLLLAIQRYGRSVQPPQAVDNAICCNKPRWVTPASGGPGVRRKSGTVWQLLRHRKVDANAADDQGRTALYWASYFGCCEIVCGLLKDEMVDVNVTDASGNTPLISACLNGHLDTVCVLLKHDKLDVHAMNIAGSTALDIARDLNMLEITQCLEEHFNGSMCCGETSGNSKRKREFSERCSKRVRS
ncbi:hypothetical protein MHU86_13718 [Fragilaria crotonensis]|nr:hypothetical protein MHU86_13718 [Fragilaria crotonensis]